MMKCGHRRLDKAGFTLVEVMLALAVTGAMLIGLIGGTFVTIAQQRYNDSLQGFAEYLSGIYDEVLSPISQGAGNSKDQAILGKVLVFGHSYEGSADDTRSVYSATLVGSADIFRTSSRSFIEELGNPEAKVSLVCGREGSTEDEKHDTTVQAYVPLWEAWLAGAGDNKGKPLVGTLIIARTPTSGSIHTIYAFDDNITYNLKDGCTPSDDSANTEFQQRLQDPVLRQVYKNDNDLKICVQSENTSVPREVDLIADGNNNSAVRILNADQSQCR